jgi:spore coat protein U-like protein
MRTRLEFLKTLTRSMLSRSACKLVFQIICFCCLVEFANAQSCTIGAASGSFGTPDVLAGTSIPSTTTFSVSCTGTANSTVRLCIEMGRGASATGPSNERALTSGANYLDFEFYTDSARTQLWGSWGSVVTAYGTGGTRFDLALGSGGSASQTMTVYAAILASQTAAAPASYSWSGSSPGMVYGYVSASACPTGGAITFSGGSTWTATVAANCNISTTSMNFGSVSSTIASNIDASATVTARCTNTTPFSIGLDNGANASGSQRRMRLGATTNFVNYGIYTDSARSNAWKTSTATTSCTAGTSTCALGTGTGSNQSVTVYGRVPPQTATAPGLFTDTVVVTVTF